MKRAASLTLLGLTILTLSACSASLGEPAQAGAPATKTPAPPTSTIVWFPPSETPTPQSVPTARPTPERKPGVGALLLTDDFSSPAPWNAAASEQGSVDVSHSRLAIAVRPGVYAFRVRQGGVYTNFYAEITALPSLCRDADEYGLLFRSPNNVAYYSFVVSCNGMVRAERVRLGQDYPLHEPVPSADVVPGAGSQLRLGVWASGTEMRFFVNGHYQFGMTDNTYKAGAVGAFVHATGQTPVTVLFSDLSVYNVVYSPATGTPNP